MKKIFFSIIIAAATMFTSCERSIEEGKSTGYLDFSLSNDSELVVLTKADGDTETITPPEIGTFNVKIVKKNSDGSDVTPAFFEGTYDDLKAKANGSIIEIEEGIYTIDVTSPNQNAENEAKYRALKENIQIRAGRTQAISMVATICNSKVTVICNNTFIEELDEFSISLTSEDNISTTWTQKDITSVDVTPSYFFNSGLITMQLNATRWSDADGSQHTVNHNYSFQALPGNHHKLTLSANATGTFDFTLEVDGTLIEKNESFTVPGFDNIQ